MTQGSSTGILKTTLTCDSDCDTLVRIQAAPGVSFVSGVQLVVGSKTVVANYVLAAAGWQTHSQVERGRSTKNIKYQKLQVAFRFEIYILTIFVLSKHILSKLSSLTCTHYPFFFLVRC